MRYRVGDLICWDHRRHDVSLVLSIGRRETQGGYYYYELVHLRVDPGSRHAQRPARDTFETHWVDCRTSALDQRA